MNYIKSLSEKAKFSLNFLSLLSVLGIFLTQLFLSGIPVHTATTNYYVSPTGSDTNDGTSINTPFKTIQWCANISTPGTVCNIRGGSYRETVNVTRSGTATDPITFQPYNNEKVTIDARDTIDPNSWTLYDAERGIYKTSAMDWDLGLGNNQIFIDSTPLHEARWPNIKPGYEELYKDSAYTVATGGGSYKLKDYTTDPASYTLRETDLVTDTSNFIVDNISTITYKANTTTDILEPSTDPSIESSGLKFGYYEFQTLPPVDLTGALIDGAVGENWGLQTSKIMSQVGNRLNIRYKRSYSDRHFQPNPTDKMYFWGTLELLDSPYEFFKDTNYLYIKPPNGKLPQDLNISVKKRPEGLKIQNTEYINFNNISIIGGSVSIVAHFITLDSMDMKYMYHRLLREKENIDGEYGLGIYGEGNIIKNNIIEYASGSLLVNNGWKGKIENNIISYASYFPIWGSANISNGGDENIIKNNTMNYSGRINLSPGGMKNKFIGNAISNSVMLTKDGGAVYSWNWTQWPNYTLSENEIAYNIISDSKDASNRIGIYLDNGLTDYSVHHNIVYGFSEGVRLNTPTVGNKIYNNTLISRRSIFPAWPGNCAINDGTLVQDCFKDVVIKNNIFGIADSRFNSILNDWLNFNSILNFSVDEPNQTISAKIDGQDISKIYSEKKAYKFSFDPVDPLDLSKGRYIDQITALYPTGVVPKITAEQNKIIASSNTFISSELSNTFAISNLSSLTTDFRPKAMTNSPIIDKGEVISGITDGFTGSAPDIGAVEYGKPFPEVGSNIFCAKNNCDTLTIPDLNQQITMESYTNSVKDSTPVIGNGTQTFDCYSAVRNNTDIVINNVKMYGLKESCVDAQKLAGENNQVYASQQRYKDTRNSTTKYYTRTIYSYKDSNNNTKFYYPHKEYWLEWVE